MTGHPDLSSQRDRFLERRAASDTHLCREKRTAPDAHAVRDLDEIVDLRPLPDAGFANGRTIDRRIGADLHVVLDHHITDLRDLVVAAIGVAGEAETVTPDDRAVLHDDAVAELHAFPDGDASVDHTVGTDDRTTANDDVWVHDRARSDSCPVANHRVGANGRVARDVTAGTDECERMDANRHRRFLPENLNGLGERQVRILRPQHGARRRFGLLAQDHRAGTGRAKCGERTCCSRRT